MARTVTLRVPNELYETVRRYAASESQSVAAWIETLLVSEDVRRRCVAHEAFLTANPEYLRFAEARADRNLDELATR